MGRTTWLVLPPGSPCQNRRPRVTNNRPRPNLPTSRQTTLAPPSRTGLLLGSIRHDLLWPPTHSLPDSSQFAGVVRHSSGRPEDSRQDRLQAWRVWTRKLSSTRSSARLSARRRPGGELQPPFRRRSSTDERLRSRALPRSGFVPTLHGEVIRQQA